jgi:hypothetical protein
MRPMQRMVMMSRRCMPLLLLVGADDSEWHQMERDSGSGAD